MAYYSFVCTEIANTYEWFVMEYVDRGLQFSPNPTQLKAFSSTEEENSPNNGYCEDRCWVSISKMMQKTFNIHPMTIKR